MIRKLLSTFLILFCVFGNMVFSQTFQWAKQMGGNGLSESGSSIAFDDSNNVYSTGHFSGVADFDPGPSVYNMTASGTTGIFISKLDAAAIKHRTACKRDVCL